MKIQRQLKIRILLNIIFACSVLFGVFLFTRPNNGHLINNSGFPNNIYEAGECLFGNYQNLVQSLEDNILNNKNRISEMNRGQLNPNQSYLVKVSQNRSETNRLNQTNAGFDNQLTQMRGKCFYFPKWD